MARNIIFVKKARKDVAARFGCSVCGKIITKGQSYKWLQTTGEPSFHNDCVIPASLLESAKEKKVRETAASTQEIAASVIAKIEAQA